MYSLIFGKRKKFEINCADVEHKVHYLGNVLTSIMKGDGCVDKAVKILWDNHVKHNGKSGIKMKMTLTQGGLKVETDVSGITEYYGHRIHYIIAHPLHPKLFVWVYQHVGKNLKTELRCHGVLCKRNRDAKLIAYMLNERLERTFAEYKREKKRMQTTRLCNFKNRNLLQVVNQQLNQHQQQVPMRAKSLSSTMKYYKPPIQKSMISAPKLDDVQEDDEFDEEYEDDKKLNKLNNVNLELLDKIEDEDEDKEQKENKDNDDNEINKENLNNDVELVIDESLIEQLSRKYESSISNNSNSSINKNDNNNNKHSEFDEASSLNSNTCDSGIEESFTLNYEFGNDIEQLKINNKENLKNNITNESIENTSSQLNKLKIDHHHHHHIKSNIDSISPRAAYINVSYDYLSDLSKCDENKIPLVKKTRSFRISTYTRPIPSSNNNNNDHNHVRNPFKRLQVSSSFSTYSTYKKYQEKLKQQQQQQNEQDQEFVITNNNKLKHLILID